RWGIDNDVTHELLKIFYSHPGLLKYEEAVRTRNYEKEEGQGFTVEGGLKDVNTMLNTGDQVGVPLPFCSTMREQFVSVLGHDLKDKEWSVLGDAARLNSRLPMPSQQKKQ
ncbi:unnamed protein product, partial [Adineta steineri]